MPHSVDAPARRFEIIARRFRPDILLSEGCSSPTITLITCVVPESSSTPRTCRCGHDLTHHLVEAQPTYGFWAWVALIGGISGKPKKITWKCQRCGEVLRETRDPRELQNFR